MTQDRIRAARQNRRHPPALDADPPVANNVDPAEETMRPPGNDPMPDRVAAAPQHEQLTARDHTVLTIAQRRNRTITWQTERGYSTHSIVHVTHHPRVTKNL